jgi:hypothetical protein
MIKVFLHYIASTSKGMSQNIAKSIITAGPFIDRLIQV